ncbi:MAG: SUMF1/EgtB/PvdO family nonheme iron enzyme [Anaerolineales bacterium]|nr:SUMF1/EgtB/PvdO family nonheme iron enzyme [Anaerolineales bacterium]
MPGTRRLRVFLCHASQDKPAVRELYKRLTAEKWIDPWLDEENLLPGQDFDLEIYRAARDSDSIIICLSKVSVAKEGYVNKEIRRALDAADEKPEGAIYIIPLRLDDCSPSFERLKKLHYADYFTPNAHEKLIKSLRLRADTLKIETSENVVEVVAQPKSPIAKDDGLDLYRFIKIDLGSHAPVPYPYWIAKYPVTNSQYERFLNADDFAKEEYWLNFEKFDESCKPTGMWKDDGLKWLQEKLKDYTYFPRDTWKVEPKYWDHPEFGITQPDNPVVGITWFEANAYCKWLSANWKRLPESRINLGFEKYRIRLPLENEWKMAAGGDLPEGRYPWDKPGKATTDVDEIYKRANVAGKIEHTTPVNQYLEGISPFGVMDMVGNVWEWQANYFRKEHDYLGLRGGSWSFNEDGACVSLRSYYHPNYRYGNFGFRLVATLPDG